MDGEWKALIVGTLTLIGLSVRFSFNLPDLENRPLSNTLFIYYIITKKQTNPHFDEILSKPRVFFKHDTQPIVGNAQIQKFKGSFAAY